MPLIMSLLCNDWKIWNPQILFRNTVANQGCSHCTGDSPVQFYGKCNTKLVRNGLQITETAIYLSFCWMHMSPQGIHCHRTQQLSPRGSTSVLDGPVLGKWCMLLTVLLFFPVVTTAPHSYG